MKKRGTRQRKLVQDEEERYSIKTSKTRRRVVQDEKEWYKKKSGTRVV
jgi:hypothetical protein